MPVLVVRPRLGGRGAAVDIEGGAALADGPGGLRELRAYPAEVQPTGTAKDEETARRLWELSERLTDVTWNLQAAPPATTQRRHYEIQEEITARPTARPGVHQGRPRRQAPVPPGRPS